MDRTVHVTLEGVRDMHAEPGDGHDHDRAEDHDADDQGHDAADQDHEDHDDDPRRWRATPTTTTPTTCTTKTTKTATPTKRTTPTRTTDVPAAITACIVGLKARPQLLLFQRFVNEYAEEPLLAVAPGVALRQLWELVAVVETALLLVSALVVVAGLVGMLAMLLANVAERRREMAVVARRRRGAWTGVRAARGRGGDAGRRRCRLGGGRGAWRAARGAGGGAGAVRLGVGGAVARNIRGGGCRRRGGGGGARRRGACLAVVSLLVGGRVDRARLTARARSGARRRLLGCCGAAAQ